MKKVVLYVRVSSKEQKEEGFSIPAQKKLLWDYAKANNFKIVKEFEDDETAKVEGRTGFGQMIKYLNKNEKVNTVLVEKTDRLYRNFKDYVTIDDLGVTVFLVKENEEIGKDASSHQKFMHGIKVLMAKNYIDNLSEEVKKGNGQKASSGIYPGGSPPFGYKTERRDGKSIIIIDEDNKGLPIKIFEWYATGLYSLQDMVNKLKESGLLIQANIPSHSRVTKMDKSSIQRMLRNPIYYGDFIWSGKLYSGIHEPLISKELWDKVQETLDRFENKKMIKKYNTLKFAFKGLMKCGECGRNITAMRKIKPSGREYVYYACTKHNTNCSQSPVTESVLDRQVEKMLEGLKLPQRAIDYVTDGLKQSLELKRSTEGKTKELLSEEKLRLEGSLDTLYEDRLNGVISKNYYITKSTEYENRIKGLGRKLEKYDQANVDYYKAGVDILELCKKASFLYQKATCEEKQRLLNHLLLNSTLMDKVLTVTYKKPFDLVYQRVSRAREAKTELAARSVWRGGRDLNLH
jgi:site-specific DNA recombinase